MKIKPISKIREDYNALRKKYQEAKKDKSIIKEIKEKSLIIDEDCRVTLSEIAKNGSLHDIMTLAKTLEHLKSLSIALNKLLKEKI